MSGVAGKKVPDTFIARFAYAIVTALFAAAVVLPAQAGDTADGVKARGRLRCGVSEGIVGFSARDASGRWAGLDADLCRAVAAAMIVTGILGDKDVLEVPGYAAVIADEPAVALVGAKRYQDAKKV